MTNQYCTSVIAMPRIDFRGFKLSHVSFSLHFFKTEAAARSLATSPTSPGLSSKPTSPQPSRGPTQSLGTPSEPDHTRQGVPTSQTPSTQPNTTAETPGSPSALMSSSVTSGHPRVSVTTMPPHTDRDKVRMRLGTAGCGTAGRLGLSHKHPALHGSHHAGFSLPAHHVLQRQRIERHRSHLLAAPRVQHLRELQPRVATCLQGGTHAGGGDASKQPRAGSCRALRLAAMGSPTIPGGLVWGGSSHRNPRGQSI